MPTDSYYEPDCRLDAKNISIDLRIIFRLGCVLSPLMFIGHFDDASNKQRSGEASEIPQVEQYEFGLRFSRTRILGV
jgi:hypothetical protein